MLLSKKTQGLLPRAVFPHHPPAVSQFKILQVFSRYLQYGGEEGSVYRIGDALQERFDVDYFIASSEEMKENAGPMLPFLTYRNFPVLDRLATYQSIGRFDCWLIHNVFPAISPGAYTLAKKLRVPIIHFLHNYRMGCVNGFWFTRGENCEKCSSGNYIHGALGKCWRGSYAQSTAMALLLTDMRRRGVFEQVLRWVAISHAQKEAHVRMGIPADRIDVVHHFLERDESELVPEFPDDGYGLFIGRLSPEKGVTILLEAWAKLGENRRLVIAGEGPEMAALQNLATSLKLNNVTFAGFVEQSAQRKLWAGAAFSIVPSVWQEPFGMVVLEAWAQGRPVVAHRIGALPEIITEGINGFLANPGKPSELAGVLENAFRSGKALEALGQNGLKTLRSDYNKVRWMNEMERVYENAGLL
jgi:glycosyltransferase involved in cell wall biosynthesis